MSSTSKGEDTTGQTDPRGSKTGMGIGVPMNAYALLIGVGKSQYSGWSLPVTVRDVAALTKVLVDPNLCAYPESRIHVLTDEDATQEGILAAVNELAQTAAADPSATFLVYYSGHGWRSVDGDGYFLVPHDVRPHELTKSALRAEDFIHGLKGIRSERLLVMIDTCHAEAMAGVKDPAASIPKGFAEEPLPDDLTEKLGTGKGRAVFLSCGEDEKSWILEGENSLSIFTHHLLKALKGAGTLPEATSVKVSDLMSHLGQEVPESARKMGQVQTPVFKFASEDFTVARVRGGRGKSAADTDQQSDLVEKKGSGVRIQVKEIHGDRTLIAGNIRNLNMGDSSR